MYESTDFGKWTRDQMKSSILECFVKIERLASDPDNLISGFMGEAVCYMVRCGSCSAVTDTRPFLGTLVSVNGTWRDGHDDLEDEYFADMNDAPARDLRNLAALADSF